MTVMRGSILYLTQGQGFSETLHAVGTGETYASMQQKLANLQSPRMQLSCGPADFKDIVSAQRGTVIEQQFLRISDDLLIRDVLVVPVTTPVGFINRQGNVDENLAAKISWKGANGAQIAVSYLHGVPAFAIGTETRKTVFSGNWRAALQNYCLQIAQQGLGFQTINNSPPNPMGPITAVTYNAGTGYYTLTMTNPVPQGKFRAAIRQMRSGRRLNGRQSCVSVAANQFMILKQVPAFTWDNLGTAVALEGYNNNVRFSNWLVIAPATAQATLLATRKLGKPFYLQLGRLSRRAG